jgi:carbon-monoxide dehydrogenase medium subunit
MKPNPFNYVRARSISEAIDLLASHAGEAKIMAGGQSLVPMLNLRIAAPDSIIDVTAIPELQQSGETSDGAYFGACVTHERIQRGETPDPSNGLMPRIAARIAYQAVRNRGTIGGSLALADPAADWLTTTVALDATIEWTGPEGPGSCRAEDFVLAAYTTRLGPADVLTGLRIPNLTQQARWGTYKLTRKTGEYAHAMATVVRSPGRSRAVLGATGGAPIRLPQTEDHLTGLKLWDDGTASRLAATMASDLQGVTLQISDVHAWQLRTCLIRAAQMSFGIEAPDMETI